MLLGSINRVVVIDRMTVLSLVPFFVSHRLSQVRVRPLLLRLIDPVYEMLEVLLGSVETERSLKRWD